MIVGHPSHGPPHPRVSPRGEIGAAHCTYAFYVSLSSQLISQLLIGIHFDYCFSDLADQICYPRARRQQRRLLNSTFKVLVNMDEAEYKHRVWGLNREGHLRRVIGALSRTKRRMGEARNKSCILRGIIRVGHSIVRSHV